MKRFALLLTAFAALSAPAMADEALAKAKNCLACHAMERKLVGPSYKDISKKYTGNAGAAAMLATKIQKGGAGAWGAIPMPAMPQVNDAEALKLSQWILSIK
jgi:cytochrome c